MRYLVPAILVPHFLFILISTWYHSMFIMCLWLDDQKAGFATSFYSPPHRREMGALLTVAFRTSIVACPGRELELSRLLGPRVCGVE
jgi:hypothetical protein